VPHAAYMLTLCCIQFDLNEDQAANATFAKALALDATATQYALLAIAYEKQARLEWKNKHYKRAEEFYRTSAIISENREGCQPTHIDALLYLGQLQHERGENAAAVKTFEEAIAASEKSGGYLLVNLRALLADAKRASGK